MAQKTYTSSFSPNQTVYHVSLSHGIRTGIVDKIQVVDDEAVKIIYFVVFGTETKSTPVDSDLWATLGSAQVGTAGGGALGAYETMLLAQ